MILPDQFMTHSTHPPQQPEPDDDALTEADWTTMEKQWRASLPRDTDAQLLDIFPEARDLIPEKIAAWQQQRQAQTRLIKEKLAVIERQAQPEDRWFWRLCVEYVDGPRLVQISGHLTRLERLRAATTGKSQPGRLTEAQIEQARRVPVETLVPTPLRQSGKSYSGRCPLHKEKTPSFHVYPDTNSWYCYGCNCGGDSISFVRHLHGLSFTKAVRYLIANLSP